MARSPAIATETFDGTGALSADFVNVNTWNGNVTRSGDVAVGGGLNPQAVAVARRNNETFDDDQYSVIEAINLPFEGGGRGMLVAARVSNDVRTGSTGVSDYYYFWIDSDVGGSNRDGRIGRVNDNAATELTTGTVSVGVNDTISIEVEGQNPVLIRAYVNDVLVLTEQSDADAARLLTGNPGFGMSINNVQGDNWAAGDVVPDTVTVEVTPAGDQVGVSDGTVTTSIIASARSIELSGANRLADVDGSFLTLSGWIYEWYDKTTDTTGEPTNSGTFDSSAGVATFTLSNSTLADGVEGTLLVKNPSNGKVRGIYELPVTVT